MMKKKEMPMLMPGAGSLVSLNSTDRGFLLLHDFAGTPAEMKYLGSKLADEGYAIMIPRYPGHGTSLKEMTGTDFKDYYRCARENLIELRQNCTKVSVIGLSMGGVIGILLSVEFELDKLVLLSTPCDIKENMHYMNLLLGRFKKILWVKDDIRGINSFQVRKDHLGYYEGKPVMQLRQFHRAIKKAMKMLPYVTAETMIVQSFADTTIPEGSIDYIYDRLGTTKKEKVFLEISNHVITVDYEKDFLVGEVIRFIK